MSISYTARRRLRCALLAGAACCTGASIGAQPTSHPASVEAGDTSGPTAAARAVVASANAGQLEEIVVTARKRTEALQDVPLAVTAFTASQIEAEHIERTEDVFRLTPGLVFDHGFSSQDTRPTIRGLPATRGPSPIGILIDGIDTTSESIDTSGGGNTGDLRLVDIERVEVIKGPQSALYGRAAFGGVISYVSQKPSFDPEYDLSLDVGGYGRVETRESATGGIVDGKLAYRANFEYSSFDGFYRNTVTNQSVGGNDSRGGAVALRFTPTDRLMLDLRLTYEEDGNGEAAAYDEGAFINHDYVSYPLPASLVGIKVGNPATTLGAAILGAKPGAVTFGPVTLSQNPLTGKDYPGVSKKSTINSLISTYDLTDTVVLQSWTGFHDVLSHLYEDLDYQGAPIVALTYPDPVGPGEPLRGAFDEKLKTHTTQISEEVRVGDLTSSGFRWAGGGMFWYEKIHQLNQSDLNYIDNLASAEPYPFSGGRNYLLTGDPPGAEEGKTTRHASVYGLVEYDVLDNLALEAEGRFTHETFDYHWLSGGGFAAVNVFYVPGAGAAAPGPAPILAAANSDSYFTPRFSAKYKLDENTLIYADIARGVKPGGYLTVSTTSVASARYQPERLWNYEIGAKTEFLDRRLLLDGALFYSDYQNKQVSTLAPDPTSASGVSQKSVNNVSAKSMGGELETAYRVTTALTLSFNYAYTYAYYSKYIDYTNTATAVIQAGNCTVVSVNNVPLCAANFSGRPMERTPRHQFNLGPTYREPVFGDWDFVGSVNAQFQSKRYEGTWSQYFASYWNVDFQAGLESPRWEVFLYGQNALDDRTVKTGQLSGDLSSLLKGISTVIAYGPDKAEFGIRGKLKF